MILKGDYYKDFFFNLFGYVKGKEKEELSGDDKEERANAYKKNESNDTKIVYSMQNSNVIFIY